MIRFAGPPELPTLLLGAGLVGCLIALLGHRLKLRSVLALGSALGLAGFALFELLECNAIPPATIRGIAAIIAPLPKAPGGAISPADERRLFIQVERAYLPLSQFRALLDMHVAVPPGLSPGIFAFSGRCASTACSQLGAGKLPSLYTEALSDWLIANWSLWRPGAITIDQTAPDLLNRLSVASAARQRFIAFMVAQRPRGPQPALASWTMALDPLVITGQMQPSDVRAYLASMADIDFRLEPRAITAGETFHCSVRRRHGINDGFSGGLPWRGRIRLISGGQSFRTHDLFFSTWRAIDDPNKVADILAPDQPGEYELEAEIVVDLTDANVRAAAAANPGSVVAAATTTSDTAATTRIKIPYHVAPSDSQPPPTTSDPDLVNALRSCIRLDTPHIVHHDGGRAQIEITVTRPPATLAVDVIFVMPSGEVVLDWFLARQGTRTRVQCAGPLAQQSGGPSKIILRPNLSLIGRPAGATAVYNGPALEFENKSFISR